MKIAKVPTDFYCELPVGIPIVIKEIAPNRFGWEHAELQHTTMKLITKGRLLQSEEMPASSQALLTNEVDYIIIVNNKSYKFHFRAKERDYTEDSIVHIFELDDITTWDK